MDYAILEWEHDEVKKKAFIENLAPIVIFTYNRLDHTKQTIEALQDNVYAKESHLYIYSDAPKNEQAKKSVEFVQNYIKTIQGFKSVTIIERDENWGLARNIIDGVTKIINQYGKIIVLEDDIVTSKYFLKYMNDALEVYKNEERVMQAGGYMYPIDNSSLNDTFFSRAGDCWGWATWARAWNFFERDPEKLIGSFSKSEIYEFNFENQMNFWQQVIDNASRKIYTWAIFWSAIIFKKHGLVIYPSHSMTSNVGFDNTGEHCGITNDFYVEVYDKAIQYFPKEVVEDKDGYLALKKYFKRIKITFWQRFINKIKSII